MKKVLIGAALAASTLIAGDLTYGIEITTGSVETDVSVNTAGIGKDTMSMGFRGKIGYKADDFRALGYLGYEKYKDAVILVDEGENISYGVEFDYFATKNVYGGLIAGIGTKDLGSNTVKSEADFTDFGARLGYLAGVMEIGIEYKIRDYDNVTYLGANIGEEDTLTSVYVGLTF